MLNAFTDWTEALLKFNLIKNSMNHVVEHSLNDKICRVLIFFFFFTLMKHPHGLHALKYSSQSSNKLMILVFVGVKIA